ncbi:hypothetical protein AB0878_42150 [Amycolatopsis sp. NPDC047767]|uniref:hypothetical protein n=1 Tax=Amycolatopsis sp. NPDC047767 TaxID=3156765 RepID=UPI0034561D63
MSEFLDLISGWGIWSIVIAVLAFGFFPAFIVQVLVRIYRNRHPRRREILAEFHDVPRKERPVWGSEQLATVVFDGLPARIGSIRKRRRVRRPVEIEPLLRPKNAHARSLLIAAAMLDQARPEIVHEAVNVIAEAAGSTRVALREVTYSTRSTKFASHRLLKWIIELESDIRNT